MELQHIVWSWPSLLARLAADEKELSTMLDRSCRALAAERLKDGKLNLALGCWLAADLVLLEDEVTQARLTNALGALLEERIELDIVPWPAGLAEPPQQPVEMVPAPDLLAGLPQSAREEAMKCETPVQRFLFAQSWRRGIKLRAQYSVASYRLDFAVPKQKVGVEIAGWRWERRGPVGWHEREQALGGEGWRVLWLAGREVVNDPEACLDELARLLGPGYRSIGDGPS